MYFAFTVSLLTFLRFFDRGGYGLHTIDEKPTTATYYGMRPTPSDGFSKADLYGPGIFEVIQF